MSIKKEHRPLEDFKESPNAPRCQCPVCKPSRVIRLAARTLLKVTRQTAEQIVVALLDVAIGEMKARGVSEESVLDTVAQVIGWYYESQESGVTDEESNRRN